MNVIKNRKNEFLLFVIVLIVTFLYFCMFTWLCGDEFWNYGFSYNISKGMIIYRDFNCLQTPLYFFLGSIFINLFGEYLYSMYLLNAVITAFMMVLLFRMVKWKAFIIWPLIIMLSNPSYNYLCLFFLFLILYLIFKGKNKDWLIGFIVGLVFLTKQSVGITFLIPCLLYSKNRKKSIICFFIPIFLLIIYLLYNNAFFDFVNYCFGGLLDFNSKNKYFSLYTFFEIGVLIYLVYFLVKSKFQDKEIFYILSFQIIIYPIFELYHFVICFIPVFYYFIKKRNSIYLFIVITFLICSIFFLFCCGLGAHFNRKDNFMYFVNDHGFLKIFEEEEKIFLPYFEESDFQFFIVVNAYARKLYMNLPINKYDLMLSGNMGYRGAERYIMEIEDMCDDKVCAFFVNVNLYDSGYTQFDKKIFDYIIENYQKVDKHGAYEVYIS